MENLISQINKALSKENARIHGEIHNLEGREIVSHKSILDQLFNHWNNISDETKEEISKILVGGNLVKHYLGDIRWVIYQYICDMENDHVFFKCGKYVYNKIQNMNGFEKTTDYSGKLDLNGELIYVDRSLILDKKVLEIYTRDYKKDSEDLYVRLYFA